MDSFKRKLYFGGSPRLNKSFWGRTPLDRITDRKAGGTPLPLSPTGRWSPRRHPDTVHPAQPGPPRARPGPAGASWAERGRRASRTPPPPRARTCPRPRRRSLAGSLSSRSPCGSRAAAVAADTPGGLRSRLDGGLHGDGRERRRGAWPEVRRRGLPTAGRPRGCGAGGGARSRRCGTAAAGRAVGAPRPKFRGSRAAPQRRCGGAGPPAGRVGPGRCGRRRPGQVPGARGGPRPRWEPGPGVRRGGGAAVGESAPGAALRARSACFPVGGNPAPPALGGGPAGLPLLRQEGIGSPEHCPETGPWEKVKPPSGFKVVGGPSSPVVSCPAGPWG